MTVTVVPVGNTIELADGSRATVIGYDPMTELVAVRWVRREFVAPGTLGEIEARELLHARTVR